MRYLRATNGDWICKYCNKVFSSRKLMLLHYKECEKKAEFAKIHGLDSLGRVKNPVAYEKATKTLNDHIKRGLLKPHKYSFSDEEKKMLSDKRIAYLEKHNGYGLKWFEVSGVKVQGTWEKKFAEYLSYLNIKFERVRIPYAKTHTYTPDFFCPSYNIYFEVKGFRRDRDIYKMYLVLDEHPDLHIKMIEREQLENLDKIDIFNLPDFQELYKREDIDMTKFKNIWK